MAEVIEHNNIFYIRDFSEIGGVETFTFQMAMKYKDLDIAIVYKTANPKQLERLKPFCKTYLHTNQTIKCKVAIINYDISIIDFIVPEAKIYQVIHGDYSNPAYTWKPPTHERIVKYIAVTKYVRDSFKKLTGLKNVTYSYNPLCFDNEKPFLKLVSATRLSKIKGKDRMIQLANSLSSQGIDYIWYIFTNDTNIINLPNIIYMKPRLDIYKWISNADYLVQLSDTEACSYSINEALYKNIPVVVTPLPYLEEIGFKDKVHGYILDFDCKNVDRVAKAMTKKPKFQFNKLEDSYSKLLAKGKSKYKQELARLVEVECNNSYYDMRLNKNIFIGDRFKVDSVRAEELKKAGVCILVD